MGSTQRITNVQTFCSNADFTKAQKPIETKVNTFLLMYMNSRDVIICYLELRKTRSVFPIPLEFEISKFVARTRYYHHNVLKTCKVHHLIHVFINIYLLHPLQLHYVPARLLVGFRQTSNQQCWKSSNALDFRTMLDAGKS